MSRGGLRAGTGLVALLLLALSGCGESPPVDGPGPLVVAADVGFARTP